MLLIFQPRPPDPGLLVQLLHLLLQARLSLPTCNLEANPDQVNTYGILVTGFEFKRVPIYLKFISGYLRKIFSLKNNCKKPAVYVPTYT